MGRLEYLTRLALGRSALGELEDLPRSGVQADEYGFQHISADGDHPDQTYDAKGRPIDPAVEVREAAQRHAQNSVLELFGVVYKEDSDKNLFIETKSRLDRSARQRLLKLEDDCGDGLQVLANISRGFLTWWADCVIAMMLAGAYPAGTKFTVILAETMERARVGGLRTFLITAFAGLPAFMIHTIVRTLLRSFLEEIVSRTQGLIIRQPWPSKKTRTVNEAISALNQVLTVFVDAALFPLEYYIAGQQMGLAPAWPPVPAWNSFNPFSPSSVFQLSSPFQRPLLLHFLCVPARMMLLQHLRNERDEGEVVMPMFTDFQYKPINYPLSQLRQPRLHCDPWGWAWSQAYLARCKILTWCGWKIEYSKEDPPAEHQFQNNTVSQQGLQDYHEPSHNSDESVKTSRVYRSTTLSQLPAAHLASTIDNCFARLIMLPLDCLLYRTYALSYLSSSFPQEHQTKSPVLQRSLWTRGNQGWLDVGSYVSKIGLGLALRTSIELGFFLGTYLVVRNRGLIQFEWGYQETVQAKTVPPTGESGEQGNQEGEANMTSDIVE